MEKTIEINAKELNFKDLNNKIREYEKNDTVKVTDLTGQRFIASGMNNKKIELNGIPGNALGAYLTGAEITVNGNAQDAVGDTMNAGKIIIHGNIGDAAGYAMRGGEIYVKGDAGYRAGIHMKEYKEKKPVIIIGGKTGSFLGEYQAGGLIIVLGLTKNDKPLVGNFSSTGMHGGKLILRGKAENIKFPGQTTKRKATKEDLDEIKPYISNFCKYFNFNEKEMLSEEYTVITPNSANPYKQMYIAN